jgi:hypothetical protein
MVMPEIPPFSRGELIRKLRKLGFAGPFSGGKYSYMKRGPGEIGCLFHSYLSKKYAGLVSHWQIGELCGNVNYSAVTKLC